MNKNTVMVGRRGWASSIAMLLMLGMHGLGAASSTEAEAPCANPRRRRRGPNGPAFQGAQEKARRAARKEVT